MDLKSLYTFLDSLTLPVQFLGFEEEFIPFPAPFTVLGRLNSVTSKSRKTGRTGIFKDFLKCPLPYSVSLEDRNEVYSTDERGIKRKHAESEAGGESPKRIRQDKVRSCSQYSIGRDLCDHEVVDLQSDEVTEALNNLNNFLKKDNLDCLFKVLKNYREEGDLEIGLGIHMIAKLTENAFTRSEKAKRNCICGCTEKLRASDEMYIGSHSTWYGELDILAGNPASGKTIAVTVCESVKDDTDENEEDNPSDCPGNRTNVEEKSQTEQSGFNQAVAQSIVFAFTEVNRHTEKGYVIPSVLIDKTMYYIVMYNPVTDVLISFSNTYNFGLEAGDNGEFIRAILVLWVTLNHRIFFAKLPKLRVELQSDFGSKINDLQKYLELKCFSKKITESNTDDFKYPIGVSYLDVSNSRETFTVFKDIETSVLNKTKNEGDNK